VIAVPWPTTIWIRHGCPGAWALDDSVSPAGCTRQIVMLYPILLEIFRTRQHPHTLEIDTIAWRLLPKVQRRTPRYRFANTSFPILVADGAPNPQAKRYRLLDGRHRVQKLVDAGLASVSAYVVPFHALRPWTGHDNYLLEG
jgi:hypothetical protein